MKAEDKKLTMAVIIVGILVIGGYGALVATTGFYSPFSMVMSESMQHDDTRSSIGCIDTGDAVIIASPEKVEIQSYVEGTQTGFKSFDDYGSVIIYEHWSNNNPVIHRAIVWLDYDSITGRWSAPSLAGYEGKWSCEGNDYMNLRGNLTFYDITQSEKTVSFNLDDFGSKKSGYLTMGDNPVTNPRFDQSSFIGSGSYLVSDDKIKSVAIHEIPWISTLKILLKNNGDNLDKVPNSLPSLIMSLALLAAAFLIIDFLSLRKENREIDKEMKKMGKL